MVTNTLWPLDNEYDKLLLMPYSEQKKNECTIASIFVIPLYNLIFQDKIQNGFHF